MPGHFRPKLADPPGDRGKSPVFFFVRFDRPGTVYVGYIHNAGQIGVVAGFETEATLAEIETMGKDVCMQICSMNPKFVDQSSVDPEYLESEKQILIQQALNEGKPANIVEKMVVGRLKKELQEVCLVNQKFVNNYLVQAPDIKRDYQVWIARYGEYKPDVKLALWQLCPDGRVTGIRGEVDINVFNGYKSQFEEFLENETIK